jgi:hypothetical protein
LRRESISPDSHLPPRGEGPSCKDYLHPTPTQTLRKLGAIGQVRHNSSLYRAQWCDLIPARRKRTRQLKTPQNDKERALNTAAVAKREAPNIMLTRLNGEHLSAWFYLCLKKQGVAQLPDVGEI